MLLKTFQIRKNVVDLKKIRSAESLNVASIQADKFVQEL